MFVPVSFRLSAISSIPKPRLKTCDEKTFIHEIYLGCGFRIKHGVFEMVEFLNSKLVSLQVFEAIDFRSGHCCLSCPMKMKRSFLKAVSPGNFHENLMSFNQSESNLSQLLECVKNRGRLIP